jgi:hypothetical protein
MLGHHSWAKNREPYANGMKVGLSAFFFSFFFNFLNKIINLFMSDFEGWFGTRIVQTHLSSLRFSVSS